MEPKFKIGDTVYLNSGGPPMKITKTFVSAYGVYHDTALVSYENETGIVETSFAFACLSYTNHPDRIVIPSRSHTEDTEGAL
jgi:hypothetical protein